MNDVSFVNKKRIDFQYDVLCVVMYYYDFY